MQKILHGQMAPTTITLEKLCYGLAATPDELLLFEPIQPCAATDYLRAAATAAQGDVPGDCRHCPLRCAPVRRPE